MLFSSVSFLYYFFPILLIFYFIVPWKYKNAVLLLFSMFFYFYGESVYILILVFSSLVDYFHGLGIEKYRGTKTADALLFSSVVINVGLLAIFKYSDFFVENVNSLFETGLALPGLALPLGISFYTFQTMSYTIDVYRGEVKAQRNLVNFATFVCMFPQLVAGPIVRYQEVEAQLEKRTCSMDSFGLGVGRFVIGLAKKVLIANSLGELSTLLYAGNEPSVLLYWTAAISFALQIYFDFSGYSDMAIGLGKMLGFNFPENFNYPFLAKNIGDFWRRWHMTLGGWFRDYVYIPMGGSRVKFAAGIRNIVIVWFLTGFWHGANWNFVLWGGYFALLLCLEKFLLGKHLAKLPTILQRAYTLFLLVFSFVIFDTTNLSLLPQRIGGMFGLGGVNFSNEFTNYYVGSYGVILLISLIAVTPFAREYYRKFSGGKRAQVVLSVAEPVILIGLLLVCTAYIVDSSFNPFLYFRF